MKYACIRWLFKALYIDYQIVLESILFCQTLDFDNACSVTERVYSKALRNIRLNSPFCLSLISKKKSMSYLPVLGKNQLERNFNRIYILFRKHNCTGDKMIQVLKTDQYSTPHRNGLIIVAVCAYLSLRKPCGCS